MKKNNADTKKNSFKENSKSEENTRKSQTGIRNSITRIGRYLIIAILIGAGLLAGVVFRLTYEPRSLTYKFDGFQINLPFKPERIEQNGMPPFSNRKITRYVVAVSPSVQYEVLVMDREKIPSIPGLSENSANSETNLKADQENTDLAQWSENTIAVLCADEAGAIRQNCLQTGSRVTRWQLIMLDGSPMYGSLAKLSDGRMIQMLAIGTTAEDAAEFFDSYKAE